MFSSRQAHTLEIVLCRYRLRWRNDNHFAEVDSGLAGAWQAEAAEGPRQAEIDLS